MSIASSVLESFKSFDLFDNDVMWVVARDFSVSKCSGDFFGCNGDSSEAQRLNHACLRELTKRDFDFFGLVLTSLQQQVTLFGQAPSLALPSVTI
jgi:hypothetical protein